MQEHEYKARDKTVKKMSREGLTEENLHSREAVSISQKEREDITLPAQAEDSFNFQNVRTQGKDGKHRRLYDSGADRTDFSGETEENVKRKRLSQRTADSETDQKVSEDVEGVDSARGASEHSARMESIRGHPSGSAYAEAAAEVNHNRKKKQVQTYSRKQREKQAATQRREGEAEKENSRFQRNQQAAEQSMEGFREEIKEKAKREQLHKEQRKKVSRLAFGDENDGMVRGAGMGISKRAISAAAGSAAVYLHGKGHEAEEDNAAVEGSHRAELMAENALRHAMNRTNRGVRKRSSRWQENPADAVAKGRLQFEAVQEAAKSTGRQAAEMEQAKKSAIRRFWQKQRYKKAYQAAKNGEKTAAETMQITQTVFAKVKRAAAAVIGRNKGIFGALAAMVLLFVLIATSLSSCGASLQGATSSIAGTTYASTDEDIYAVENAYAALEDALNSQINSIESRHSGYDEYRYQVDEISHNPYQLISYFTAKYGEFTYEQVKDEVEEIFRQQYSISTESTRETVTETKTVRVGESLGQVVTSGYCSCAICCGVWAGGPTASGVYPTANHTIAVDANNPFVPMGTKVVMNGVEYVVEDTGAFAQYGVQFDVYYDAHASALAHGHQTWEAYIADDNGSQEVEVTSTREVNRLDVTMTNHNLDAVLRSRMDENEEKRYDLYNTTYGNRNYLFDVNTLPGGGAGGFGYDIPAEALSDQKFANMIREAEKYLGYPYVWGGASPSTSFDCSGFVSWVINNCGNGWNVGRQTADGLRSCCAYVSPSEAKPGDLVFFQGTYNTSGASHVGIYVGNNMMIHCGNPIQYTSIASSYWQEHFMAFGRIH
ncbi:CD1108 family mobile element protein [Anaerostipes hominis (ex Lee et al. 2021)]|uniref:C40 family peptidase n=1 Tax=Anaerostipes hominis (ex Lee et al. 2021) TaxID=2025494 RepID=UPI0022E30AD1|nr:NlpC/P60 family protein [Anaerostipes hominis (ex Lee et al. 2021)]